MSKRKDNAVFKLLAREDEKEIKMEHLRPITSWEVFGWMWERLAKKKWANDFMWYNAADDLHVFVDVIDPLALRDAIYEYAKERKMI